MATSSQLKAGHSLEWNTEPPDEDNGRVSPAFRIRGIEHYFKLSGNGTLLTLELECSNEAPYGRFNILLYVQLIQRGFTYLVREPRMIVLGTGRPYHVDIDHSKVASVTKSDIWHPYKLRFLFVFDRADKPRILEETEHKSVQTPVYFDANFAFQSLSEDLSKLLDHGCSITDMELVCQGRTFKAHRSLLSARSDVFRAMLKSDMTEGKTGIVQIEDVEAEIFEKFLRYLYKGKLEELTQDTVVQLYKLCDRYAVGPLKKQCISFLEENLDQFNACCILSLADQHSDQDLKEVTMAYMVQQQIPIQRGRAEWSSFSTDHPVLAVEVMTRLCNSLASVK